MLKAGLLKLELAAAQARRTVPYRHEEAAPDSPLEVPNGARRTQHNVLFDWRRIT